MTASNQHGGKRGGAGRPRGSLNKRSLEAIQEVAERYPGWSPLLHVASVANDETLDPEIRLDAARAALPYCHAKLRPVVADADELVELEARLAEARAKATVKELAGFDDLADRLSRARARNDLTEAEHAELARLRLMVGNVVIATNVPRAPDDPLTIDAAPAPPEPALKAENSAAEGAGQAVEPPIQPAPAAPPSPPPPAYEPILPDWPQKTQFAECDYEAFNDGLLAGRR